MIFFKTKSLKSKKNFKIVVHDKQTTKISIENLIILEEDSREISGFKHEIYEI